MLNDVMETDHQTGAVGGHAVVIGASIAGLCAARVLTDHFDTVTVYERDALPEGPAQRAAVPQGRHVHLLMARGALELERMFPGLLDDMVAAGVPILENRPDCIHFAAAGHVLGTKTTLRDEFTAWVPSRPHLEWQLRRRVRDLPGVTLVDGDVDEPVYDPARRRVVGVALADGSQVPADLVVDATGRGTRLPVWLTTWGYRRVHEQTVGVGIAYASAQVRIPDDALTERVIVVGASHTEPVGLGMLRYEDGLWTVTAFGTGRAREPRTVAEIRSLADRIAPAHVAAALRDGEFVGELAFHKYPVSRWRRYDELDRFPAGIVPFGDAVVSFNPTYGQGMTMTAIQAVNLDEALGEGPADLFTRLSTATARTTYPVWTMNAVGDLVLHNAKGDAPWWYPAVGSLFDQFLGAAETEPVLAEWFLRRFSLLDSLYMVPPVRLVGRTVRHNMGLFLAEKRRALRGGRSRRRAQLVTSQHV